MMKIRNLPGGVSFRNPITVDAAPRDPVPGGSDAAVRRLERLAVPRGVDITELGEMDLVIDVELFTDAPSEAAHQYQVRHEKGILDRYKDMTPLQRGGGTHRSCVYLRWNADRDEFRVDEYALRLPRPGTDHDHTETATAVADLVADVGPPTATTGVWVRQSIEDGPASVNSIRRGQHDVIDALRDPYPHVGEEHADVRLPTLVAFVADLKRAYADRFEPPALD